MSISAWTFLLSVLGLRQKHRDPRTTPLSTPLATHSPLHASSFWVVQRVIIEEALETCVFLVSSVFHLKRESVIHTYSYYS